MGLLSGMIPQIEALIKAYEGAKNAPPATSSSSGGLDSLGHLFGGTASATAGSTPTKPPAGALPSLEKSTSPVDYDSSLFSTGIPIEKQIDMSGAMQPIRPPTPQPSAPSPFGGSSPAQGGWFAAFMRSLYPQSTAPLPNVGDAPPQNDLYTTGIPPEGLHPKSTGTPNNQIPVTTISTMKNGGAMDRNTIMLELIKKGKR